MTAPITADTAPARSTAPAPAYLKDTAQTLKIFDNLALNYKKAKWQLTAVGMIHLHELGARDGKIDKFLGLPIANRLKHAFGDDVGKRVYNACLNNMVKYDREIVAAKGKGTWLQCATYLGARLGTDFEDNNPGEGWTMFIRPNRAPKQATVQEPGPVTTTAPVQEQAPVPVQEQAPVQAPTLPEFDLTPLNDDDFQRLFDAVMAEMARREAAKLALLDAAVPPPVATPEQLAQLQGLDTQPGRPSRRKKAA